MVLVCWSDKIESANKIDSFSGHGTEDGISSVHTSVPHPINRSVPRKGAWKEALLRNPRISARMTCAKNG